MATQQRALQTLQIGIKAKSRDDLGSTKKQVPRRNQTFQEQPLPSAQTDSIGRATRIFSAFCSIDEHFCPILMCCEVRSLAFRLACDSERA